MVLQTVGHHILWQLLQNSSAGRPGLLDMSRDMDSKEMALCEANMFLLHIHDKRHPFHRQLRFRPRSEDLVLSQQDRRDSLDSERSGRQL